MSHFFIFLDCGCLLFSESSLPLSVTSSKKFGSLFFVTSLHFSCPLKEFEWSFSTCCRQATHVTSSSHVETGANWSHLHHWAHHHHILPSRLSWTQLHTEPAEDRSHAAVKAQGQLHGEMDDNWKGIACWNTRGPQGEKINIKKSFVFKFPFWE